MHIFSGVGSQQSAPSIDPSIGSEAANAMAKNRLEAVVGVIHRQLQAAASLH